MFGENRAARPGSTAGLNRASDRGTSSQELAPSLSDAAAGALGFASVAEFVSTAAGASELAAGVSALGAESSDLDSFADSGADFSAVGSLDFGSDGVVSVG